MAIKKKIYTWQDIENMCLGIVNQMYKEQWRPDYIVGITRGGNVPATIISNMTGIRCEALKVALRDGDSHQETNCWMSEDAFGYDEGKKGKPKKILIVDDINDTGATFEWIKQDWQASCMPSAPQWRNIWGHNVKWAVLTDNLSSDFSHAVSYCADTVNKAEEDVWLVYPWENVGQYHG